MVHCMMIRRIVFFISEKLSKYPVVLQHFENDLRHCCENGGLRKITNGETDKDTEMHEEVTVWLKFNWIRG